jgi:hypothetical protein
MSRSRHKFINPTSEKSKVNSRIARQRRKVLNMTRNFLKQEREGLYKPLPPEDTDTDLLLTPDEIQIIKNSEPPTKKRRMTKGGRRKKGRKTRRKKRKRKMRKMRKMRKTKRGGDAKKNFKKNLLHNIEKNEKKLKPMINSIISKYYKGKKKMSYSILKKIIKNSENKVLEKVGKEVKEIMAMRKSVMKGGAGDEVNVIPFAISAFSFCFIVCFMLYVLLSCFDSGISRFYIMSQGGYQQMVERTGWREADNNIRRTVKKIKREIVFLLFLMCMKSSINNYHESQERMRQFRLLSPLQQQRVMIEHQERINRQNVQLQQFNEELDEVRDVWDRIRGSTNLNRNLDVQRMIRDIRSNHDIGESKGEGKQ